MNKYNNIKSIAIEELSKKELHQAIREWAEGDNEMEKLLWSCYKNGVKTSGCHAGIRPYIGIEYEEKNKEKMVQLIDTVLSEKKARILLSPDGGNPFSGSNWYKPDIALGSDVEKKHEADQLFKIMSDRINNSDNKNLNYLPLVNLFEFLIGKYSGLHIRIEYNQKDELVFTIEKCIHEEEMIIFDELNSLLTSAGLIYVDNGNPHKSWIFKSNNQIIFINKIKSISEWICNNYTIKKPESVEKTSSYNIKAHIKRDEFLKNNNKRGFDLWLMEEEKKLDEDMYKRYSKREK